MKIDLLWTTFNRLEFARESLLHLIQHTDWGRVARIVVYDDGSTDGTRQWLDHALAYVPAPTVLRAERGCGPVWLMGRHVQDPESAPVFAKIDSDVAVPEGWLDAMLSVMERHPELEMLGMEAGMSGSSGAPGPVDSYGWAPAAHIGGVGLMRLDAFQARPRLLPNGRHGFTEWQHAWAPTRGWITPDLPVVLLDRLPFEPWRSLAVEYQAAGWQRRWEPWGAGMEWAWQWLAPGATVPAAA